MGNLFGQDRNNINYRKNIIAERAEVVKERSAEAIRPCLGPEGGFAGNLKQGPRTLGARHTADAIPDVLIAAARTWADARGGEAQAVGAVGDVRAVHRRRPIVAFGAAIVKRRPINVPGVNKVVGIASD